MLDTFPLSSLFLPLCVPRITALFFCRKSLRTFFKALMLGFYAVFFFYKIVWSVMFVCPSPCFLQPLDQSEPTWKNDSLGFRDLAFLISSQNTPLRLFAPFWSAAGYIGLVLTDAICFFFFEEYSSQKKQDAHPLPAAWYYLLLKGPSTNVSRISTEYILRKLQMYSSMFNTNVRPFRIIFMRI